MSNEKMRQFFHTMEGLALKVTFDDVRLVPQTSNVLPGETDTRTRFSKRVALKVPIVSSPMDTVTTGDMAIAMALSGGLGIIHRGLSPEMQAKEVGRVKNRLHGKVFTPLTVQEDQSVESVLTLCKERRLPFRTFPVLNAAGGMVGLLTGNDFDFCEDPSVAVREIMTPRCALLTAGPSTRRREALPLMAKHKKKVLPLVDENQRLAGMYVFSDLKRNQSPEESGYNLDSEGRLIVGAAVGVGELASRRAELLAKEGCDVFVIDTAHGDSSRVFATLVALKKHHPSIDVIAGNVSSGDSAIALAEAGADGILVGQGPGSICTTRVIAGIGVPQVSAVYDCASALAKKELDVPVCADGGISNSGDSVIALAVGASSVMLGRLLAGTDEAPGGVEILNDKRVKVYRGMGSLGAMRDNASSRERYGQSSDATKSVPEGVESVVQYRGAVSGVLDLHVGGIRSGLGYHGARTLDELREKAEPFRMSSAGLAESHPHDVQMIVASPNYNGN